MARLNKQKLTEKQLQKLFRQLSTTLSQLASNDTDRFLSDLLGPEEKIMLAKRLGIVVLLLEGYSLYKIASLLKVSPATAKHLKSKIDSGEMDCLINSIKKNKVKYLSILETIDSILHLGGTLPHYNGPDRYKCLKN